MTALILETHENHSDDDRENNDPNRMIGHGVIGYWGSNGAVPLPVTNNHRARPLPFCHLWLFRHGQNYAKPYFAAVHLLVCFANAA
jgi:hypothetical protein